MVHPNSHLEKFGIQTGLENEPDQLTVLFDVVVGVTVPTPGRHLGSPKTNAVSSLLRSPSRAVGSRGLTGITLGLLDRRSREVTWRVWSSVHRTSSVNSTEHSGQKSSQVQSCRAGAEEGGGL